MLTGLRLGFCLPGNGVCSKRLCFPLCLPHLQRREWVCPPSAGSCKAAHARKSLRLQPCVSGNKCSPVESHSVGMAEREKGEGEGKQRKRGKEQALYQKQAAALNLDLSCSSLKEHACNKCKRVHPSEAESWGDLPSFSMVAVLSLQIRTRPGVSPGWGLFCPKRRAPQQHVLSEAVVLVRCVTP